MANVPLNSKFSVRWRGESPLPETATSGQMVIGAEGDIHLGMDDGTFLPCGSQQDFQGLLPDGDANDPNYWKAFKGGTYWYRSDQSTVTNNPAGDLNYFAIVTIKTIDSPDAVLSEGLIYQEVIWTAFAKGGAIYQCIVGTDPNIEWRKQGQLDQQFITKAEYDAMMADPALAKEGVRYIVTDDTDNTLKWLMPDYANQHPDNKAGGGVGGVGANNATWTATAAGYIRGGFTSSAANTRGVLSVNGIEVWSDFTVMATHGIASEPIPVKAGDVCQIKTDVGTGSGWFMFFIPTVFSGYSDITYKPVNQLLTMGPPDYANPAHLQPSGSPYLIPATPLNYTMPCDGYFKSYYFKLTAIDRQIRYALNGVWLATILAQTEIPDFFGLIPVKKGDVVTVTSNDGNTIQLQEWFNECIPAVINPPVYLQQQPVLNYSTIEQLTGEKDEAGKDIYRAGMVCGYNQVNAWTACTDTYINSRGMTRIVRAERTSKGGDTGGAGTVTPWFRWNATAGRVEYYSPMTLADADGLTTLWYVK